MKNKIAKLEDQLFELRAQLLICTDGDEKANLDEKIDSIQDDIDELESDVDPEDIYGVMGHTDNPEIESKSL